MAKRPRRLYVVSTKMVIIKKWVRTGNIKPKQRCGTVDLFYLVEADAEVKDWIVEQEQSLWIFQEGWYGNYWVDEKLLVLMTIKWPDSLMEDL